MKPRPVVIPKSPLATKLDEAEAIKLEMTHLLRELEEHITGRPVKNPGTWRQPQSPQ